MAHNTITIGKTQLKVLSWNGLVWGVIVFLFGSVLMFAAGALAWGWFTAKYTPREYVPYRTALAQVEPGYSFNPGYPSVVVSMEQFRKESVGKPYILSYPVQLSRHSTDTVGKVHYLMLKSTTVGNVYIVSSENIPDYWRIAHGSQGYREYTGFDAERIAYVSVLIGTSYWSWFLIILLFPLGFTSLVAGLVMMDSSVLIRPVLSKS